MPASRHSRHVQPGKRLRRGLCRSARARAPQAGARDRNCRRAQPHHGRSARLGQNHAGEAAYEYRNTSRYILTRTLRFLNPVKGP
jgi:hypothetical protein